MDLEELLTVYNIKKFLIEKLEKNEIYNEVSFQHELAIYLRTKLDKKYRVDFERNIIYFKLAKKFDGKREIDLSIYEKDKDVTNEETRRYAIELKYPAHRKNIKSNDRCITGEYIYRMNQFNTDSKFMKEVSKKFTKTYSIVLVDDHNFYDGKANKEPYKTYRKDKKWHDIFGDNKEYKFYINVFESGELKNEKYID